MMEPNAQVSLLSKKGEKVGGGGADRSGDAKCHQDLAPAVFAHDFLENRASRLGANLTLTRWTERVANPGKELL